MKKHRKSEDRLPFDGNPEPSGQHKRQKKARLVRSELDRARIPDDVDEYEEALKEEAAWRAAGCPQREPWTDKPRPPRREFSIDSIRGDTEATLSSPANI